MKHHSYELLFSDLLSITKNIKNQQLEAGDQIHILHLKGILTEHSKPKQIIIFFPKFQTSKVLIDYKKRKTKSSTEEDNKH